MAARVARHEVLMELWQALRVDIALMRFVLALVLLVFVLIHVVVG